jgi:calcineurin-like phosphoesterase family protein
MSNTFLVSDTHFGHKNICVFKNYDGSPLRPWDNVDEMDEEMVKRWNDTVKPNDKVYHCGDVVINRKSLEIISRLNGDKVLIKGNHDIFKLSDYMKYFRDIRAYHVLNGFILSHVPIERNSVARFRKNIHGHTHGNQVMLPESVDPVTGKIIYSKDKIDPLYFSVCVEKTNFTPILIEEVIKRIKQRDIDLGFTDDRVSILGPD